MAREAGDAVDRGELDDAIRRGVEKLVRQQVAGGVDWINDGEASKASYMTYHTDDFPASPSSCRRRRPAAALRYTSVCTGPVAYTGQEAVRTGHRLEPPTGYEWQVFEEHRLPEGKYLIPRVVDVETNIVEHPKLIAQRLVRYAKLVGRENVIAGTDCGFASLVSLHTVLLAVAWESSGVMREGADLARRQLW